MRRLRILLALILSLGLAASAPAMPRAAWSSGQNGQIVLVQLKLSDDKFGASGESFRLYDVEDALEAAVAGKGELDGHEIGGGYLVIYIYGPDSAAILKAIGPALKSPLVRKGSYLMVGPEEDPARRRKLSLPLAGS